MYKVLLVDDEYYYREALKNTISWESCGCIICGEANNGAIGVERAKELQPDIILADVNMPFMDGLQMIEEIKKFLPEFCGIFCNSNAFGLGMVTQIIRQATFISKKC